MRTSNQFFLGFSLLLIAKVAHSETMVQETFYFDGQPMQFLSIRSKRITISTGCMQKSGNFKCLAFDMLSRASVAGLDADLEGGANLGAVICSQKLGGHVVYSEDRQGNQNSFCLFRDSSMVDSGTIAAFAR